MSRQLLLASASPRRRELLGSLGLKFRVVASGVSEEDDGGLPPAKLAAGLALEKANAVLNEEAGEVVIGADTVVVVDGEVLGKPVDPADARRMLELLRDRWHEVITGVAVVSGSTGSSLVRTVQTAVLMGDYSEQTIRQYVASGEPIDKAGSYAIQGRGGELVSRIEGCYTNVVGLPVCEVAEMLRRVGVEVNRESPVCTDPAGAPCPRAVSS
jgi:septum formation protein